MTLLASTRPTTRIMIYAMVCTLIIAFGSIGAMLAGNVSEQYALVGLFIGSALGAFVAVHEATIVGTISGMLVGLLICPLVYYCVDFETAYLSVFVASLLGAVMGEPMSSFWREAEIFESSNYDNDRDDSLLTAEDSPEQQL